MSSTRRCLDLSATQPPPTPFLFQVSGARGIRNSLPRPAFGSSPNLQVRSLIFVHTFAMYFTGASQCRVELPLVFCTDWRRTASPSFSLHLRTPQCFGRLVFAEVLCVQHLAARLVVKIIVLVVVHIPLFQTLQALALEADEAESMSSTVSFFEITIAAKDQPKLLSRLTDALVSVLLYRVLSFEYFLYFLF
jgi:hypothetical protein